MSKAANEPPAVDPDNVGETLCIGRFNLLAGPGPLATLTFTNIRAKAGPLLDRNEVEHESVVRARIVTTIDNLVALRDLLTRSIQESTPVVSGGSYTIN